MTIVGCGYTGKRLARACRARKVDVLGLVRTRESLLALAAEGVAGATVDLDALAPGDLPREAVAGRALVYMVPPPDEGEVDPRLAAFLDAAGDAPTRIVCLGTTAVYGDRAGAAVSEDDRPAPDSPRGLRRLDAERRVLAWGERHARPAIVLRVPGIYGPGRLPLRRIREGAPVPEPDPARPGNRIHVDDLAGACLAALEYQGGDRVFNVGDGEHAPMGEYYQRVARLAGLPDPPALSLAELLPRVSPAMRGFLVESRRVDTTRMREELGYRPRYADLDAGIAASLAEEGHGGG